MTTGDEIRAARQRAGLTQQQLAERVGVTMRTVGNWERGETLSERYAARLASVLDGLIQSAETPSIEDYSDAALLAEIARRFDRTRSSRDRSASSPRTADSADPVARDAQQDGATTPPADAMWMPESVRPAQGGRDEESEGNLAQRPPADFDLGDFDLAAKHGRNRGREAREQQDRDAEDGGA
ncbi:helix-turn-helix transcriptional regulator [Brachybacterium subflavum]|uniref:helix-turn-helix transcriptional regulator n=1 Tax=Brachybacterium subflavum TaxID=2585206 RepID=UPI001D0CF4BE|nr:helix-turn-helix transcriptional regulator [Brachybacterium subflavum]